MADNTPTTDLVVAGESSSYAVLRMAPADITELLRENLGGDSLTVRDLEQVSVPSGGGRNWEVPTVDGLASLPEIEGVIVHRATRRAYWTKAYDGSNEQPDCFSDDGVLGIGDPGGDCASCPYNEFESAENGIGKACKEVRQLFVLTADSLIPIVINVPAASLANVKAYVLRLLRVQLSPLDVVTKVGLEVAQSKGGIKYSRVTLARGGSLDDDAKVRLRAYAAQLEPAFQQAARGAATTAREAS